MRRRRPWSQPGGGGGGGPTPAIDDNWLVYGDADAGPVGTPSTAVGNPVTDWLSLAVTGGSGPYDFAQSGSADRGVLSDTTASDGRLTVDFDGVSDFMEAVGDLGGELEGDDVDFTRFIHFQALTTSGTEDLFSLCNNSGDNRDQIQSLGDDVRSLRRVTTTITNTGADVLPVGEHVIVDMRVGDTRTIWVDGVKVVDAAAEATGSITFSQVILAAVDIGAITNPAEIGVRRFGLRLGGITDPQAAELAALSGT